VHLEPRLLRLAAGHRGALAATVGAGIAAGIAIVVQAAALARVVHHVLLDSPDHAALSGPLTLLLAAIVVRAALVGLGEYFGRRAAAGITLDLRNRLTSHLFDVGPVVVGRQRTGELAAATVDGVEKVTEYFSHYLPQVALATAVPLTVIVVVFTSDPLSGVVLLLTAPLIPLFMWLIGRAADNLARRQVVALGRMGAFFLDVIQGLTMLKMLGRARDQIEAVARVTESFRRRTMAVLRVAFLSAFVLELVATLSTAVVAVEVGLRLLGGRLDFEAAFFVLLLTPEFYLPLRLLGTRFHSGAAGAAASQRLFEILDLEPVVRTALSPVAMASTSPTVIFDDVCCTYPGGTRSAVDSVNLRIAPGERVALVGPSGAGKSTIGRLLLAFLQPEQGRITIDGRDLADLDLEAWRRMVAWVPQRPHLFHGSVADNIRLGRPDADDTAVAAAARSAAAHDEISAFPEGYETSLGEGGFGLSGGQAQRVALARAFLRAAPLLVLDEPTASLDPETERDLEQSVNALLADRSALVIAHRLATARSADRVVVLERGQVIACNHHSELLTDCDLYRRMVAAEGGGSS